MTRPLGSKNKTPRELRAEGKHKIEKANLKERIAKLENKTKKK